MQFTEGNLTMHAIEFETIVENRNIVIPQQYTLDSQKVRVIILTEATVASPKRKLMDIIADAKGKGCFQSAAEIDQFLAGM
jgi:hypothetical protein